MSLWDKSAGAVPIDASQLVVGLFIWLDLKWSEHPFISNRMLIKTVDDIDTMQSLNITGRLYYLPDKSEVPLPARAPVPESVAAVRRPVATKFEVPQELQDIKNAALVQQKQYRTLAGRTDRAWDLAARQACDVFLSFNSAPKAASAKLHGLSAAAAASVTEGDDVLLHLLGQKSGGGQHFHAINTMTLCMLLGKKIGLDEQTLTDLAMAALLHDAGKSEVLPRILSLSQRNKFEEDQYRMHLRFSLSMAVQSGRFSPQALTIMAEHHEAVDGSGWPTGKKDLSVGARILTLVDRYDSLCTPEAADVEPLVPMEALSTLLKRESSRFDTAILGHFIKLLGIYPPGTMVQLSDGALCQVVAPGPHSLKPRVLVYNPLTSKDEAHMLALDKEPEVKITAAVRPASLPPEVRTWFRSEQPQVYFFATGSRAA
jgi:HD-GYP domain-containing protein (c-di-GMP phosphodiesterase class II)